MPILTTRRFSAICAVLISVACCQSPASGQTPLNGANTIGVFRGSSEGAWIINSSGTDGYQGGVSDPVFYFGLPGDQPVVGNWTGASPAVLQVGVFRDGYWYLDWDNNEMWDVNPGGGGDVVVAFGLPPSPDGLQYDTPVVGDWNHDGTLHIGVMRTFSDGTALWYVQTGCSSGAAVCDYDPIYTAVFSWGVKGDVPVVGDWDQSGLLRVGVVRPGPAPAFTAQWIVNLLTALPNQTNCGGNPRDLNAIADCNGYPGSTPDPVPFDVGTFSLGSNSDTPVVGNWTWNGASLGYMSPGTFNNGTWSVVDKYLSPYPSSQNSPWSYGLPGDVPVVGPWRDSTGLAHPPPSTPNALSINGGGSTGDAPQGTQATFAFTFYDSYYGANGIASGQVFLASNSNPDLCNLYWWRPGGAYELYLNTNGTHTSSFNTNVSDGNCTVSLVSIVNSTSDPTAVTVTLNYTFSAATAPGIYDVNAFLWDITGETSTAIGTVGTFTVDPPITLVAKPNPLNVQNGSAYGSPTLTLAIVAGVSGAPTLMASGFPSGFRLSVSFPTGTTFSPNSPTANFVVVDDPDYPTDPGEYGGIFEVWIGGFGVQFPIEINVMKPPPTITSIVPSSAMVGTSVSVTVYGNNLTNLPGPPTVNWPSGITVAQVTSISSTSVTETINVGYSTIIGNYPITISGASGVTSNALSFLANGPVEMVVASDLVQYDDDNVTPIERDVKYNVVNFDNSPAQTLVIAEAFSTTGWSCQQAAPSFITAPCDGSAATPNGSFLDKWTIFGGRGYTPTNPASTSCGYEGIVDHWEWCSPGGYFAPDAGPVSPAAPIPFGTLTGFAHTDADEIFAIVNGTSTAYANPPSAMPADGTAVIKP